MTSEESVPETVATYLRLRGLPSKKRYWSKKKRSDDDENQPFKPGRDPLSLGVAIEKLVVASGWQENIDRESVVLHWAEIAGPDVAQHSDPVSLEHGMLTVKCGSTAWAKQLQFMRAGILTRIQEQYPNAGVDNLRFIGPDVPSWKWGTRAVPGRGPRDTYG
jgi:predicted nucleic acid-binding Zn ribbon protein